MFQAAPRTGGAASVVLPAIRPRTGTPAAVSRRIEATGAGGGAPGLRIPLPLNATPSSHIVIRKTGFDSEEGRGLWRQPPRHGPGPADLGDRRTGRRRHLTARQVRSRPSETETQGRWPQARNRAVLFGMAAFVGCLVLMVLSFTHHLRAAHGGDLALGGLPDRRGHVCRARRARRADRDHRLKGLTGLAGPRSTVSDDFALMKRDDCDAGSEPAGGPGKPMSRGEASVYLDGPWSRLGQRQRHAFPHRGERRRSSCCCTGSPDSGGPGGVELHHAQRRRLSRGGRGPARLRRERQTAARL